MNYNVFVTKDYLIIDNPSRCNLVRFRGIGFRGFKTQIIKPYKKEKSLLYYKLSDIQDGYYQLKRGNTAIYFHIIAGLISILSRQEIFSRFS